MSEEIFLGGAHFDNSMPKWATEDTIKRLGLEFKKDRTVSSKQHDKMIKLLGAITQSNTKAEKTQKDQTSELKSILKEIRDLHKVDKEVLAELKKANRDKKSSGGSKPSAPGTQKPVEIDDFDIVDSIDRNRSWLQKIHGELEGMTRDFTRSINSHGKEMSRTMQSTQSRDEGGNKTDDFLEDVFEQQNGFFSRMKEKYGAGTNAGMNASVRSSQGSAKRFNNGVTSMVASMAAFGKKIGKIIGMLFSAIKKIPIIGAKIAAAAAAINAAVDFASLVTDSFDEYKRMLNAGFSFTREIVEGVQMDGIKVRKMIAEAGLTFETGLEAMNNNMNLVNDMGVEDFIGTIQNVMGNAQDAAAFMNRVMMSQDEITKFSSEYLKSLQRMGDYERMMAEDRAKGIQEFIANTRYFGKMTGQSIEDLMGIISDLREDPTTANFLRGLEDEQRVNAENALQAMGAVFGKDSEMFKQMTGAITDMRGMGVAALENQGAIMKISNMLTGGDDLYQMMDDMIRGIQSGEMGREEITDMFVDINKMLEDGRENMTKEQQAMLDIWMKTDGVMKTLMSGIYNIDSVLGSQERLEQFRNQGEGNIYDSERSTEAATLEHQTQTTGYQRDAAIQAAMANLADSGASRTLMEGSYKVMIEANNIAEKGAHAAVTSAHSLMNNLPKISTRVTDIFNYLTGNTREDNAEEALDRGSDEMNRQAKTQFDVLRETLRSANIETDVQETGWFSTSAEEQLSANQKHQNVQRLKRFGLDLESLKKDLTGGDERAAMQAREMLGFMSSKQMEGVLGEDKKEEYRELWESSLEEMPDNLREQFLDNFTQKVESGLASMEIATRVQMMQGQQANNQENQTRKESDNMTQSQTQRSVEEQKTDVEREEERRTDRRREETQRERERRDERDRQEDQNRQRNGVFESDSNHGVDGNSNDVILRELLNPLISRMEEVVTVIRSGNVESINELKRVNQNIEASKNNGSVSS